MTDLFNLGTETLSAFEPKKRSNDGIYRIDMEKVSDPTKGYIATVRFLPNLTKEKKVGKLAIDKFINWINIPVAPDLNGAFISKKNFGERCMVNDLYWKLRNANKLDLAKQISGSVQYYSYIYIIKDEQQPELEGKIMIFQYGKKIADKIKEEKMGMGEDPCNVFDLLDGKNFVLNVKKVGGFNNYDSSKFVKRGPLEIDGTPVDKMKKTDVYKWLLERDKDLEEYDNDKYDEERAKLIVQVMKAQLAGKDIPISSANTESAKPQNAGDNKVIDEFFEDL